MSHDPGAESSAAFRTYMQHFDLSTLDVALAAQVRLLTVWNIAQGLPIREEHAQAVRAGLLRLTSVPYTGPIPIIPASLLFIAQASPTGKQP
jgi:hypothetical protein